MIESLFSSQALFRTLALFFRYPDESLNPGLISRYTGGQNGKRPSGITKTGEEGGNPLQDRRAIQIYLLDRDHPVHEGLRSIFAAGMWKKK